MKTIIIVSFTILLILLSGCADKNKNYIGSWTNKIDGRGDMKITITKDGDYLLVKEEIMSTGGLVGLHRGKIKDDYLIVDGSIMFGKLFYSESQDMLIPENDLFPGLPGFRRIK